ncbi:transposase [Marinilabilia rubra]|uniref:Transposase n=1 Tax=Marinilabilia rubra TaxID=2162893 RepID=A0A2U2BA76_9BACT|nr:transposase [Marinilabilia rubra]PWD99975.1 transposase [Marinilabilia rubra]
MKKKRSQFQFRPSRYFSEDFKKQKVHEIVTKKATVREISNLYEIRTPIIYRWIHKYSSDHPKQTKIVVEMESESQKALFYKEKVAELERLVGQKQIQLDFMEKLIELASEELDMDLKKNFSSKLLNGSGNTSKNNPSP